MIATVRTPVSQVFRSWLSMRASCRSSWLRLTVASSSHNGGISTTGVQPARRVAAATISGSTAPNTQDRSALMSAKACRNSRWEFRHALALISADLSCVLVAVLPLVAAAANRRTGWAPSVLIPPLWLLLATVSRSYEPRHQARIDNQLRKTCETGVRTVAIVLAVGFATRWDPPHRRLTLASLVLLIALPAVGRLAVRQVLHGLRRRGHWLHRVVAVGPVDELKSFVAETAARPEGGLVVVGGCATEKVEALEVNGVALPLFGRPELVGTAARALAADAIAVLPHALPRHQVRKLAWELEGTDIELLVAPALTDVAGPRISVRPMNAFALLHLEQPSFTGVRESSSTPATGSSPP